MATGTLQQSGGVSEQINQMISTLGGTPVGAGGGLTDLLKSLNTALTLNVGSDVTVPIPPQGAVAETIPRAMAAQSLTIADPSGTVLLNAIYIPVNTVVNNINFVTGTTPSSADVTHNWAVLCDKNRVPLATSADTTSGTILASTVQTFPIANVAGGAATSFTTTYSGLYYVGYMAVVTTTQPTMIGVTGAASTLNNIAPKTAGSSSTGQTTPPTSFSVALTAITASASTLYAFLT